MKKLVLLGIILSSVSIAYSNSVDLPWFGEYQDWVASYGFDNCVKILGTEEWKYSCRNFILTLNAENGGWNIHATNSNNNWTTDYGLCQLNDRYHSNFIQSGSFEDPYKQIDYCLEVRQDAKRKGTMPWYWYSARQKRDKGINFRTLIPPLSQNIAEPIKPKRVCRQVATIQKDEYLQIDNKFHQFKKRLKDLWIGDKIFICKDF